jgi:hypothetical protein
MSSHFRFIALLAFLFVTGCQPLPSASALNSPYSTPTPAQTGVNTSIIPPAGSTPFPTQTQIPPELRSESLFSLEVQTVEAPTVVTRLRVDEDEIGWNTMEIGGGALWLGTNNSSIEILDPETGERQNLIRLLIPGKSQFGGSVLDLVFDGRYVWAALSRMDDLSGSLMVIDPEDNSVIAIHPFPPGWMPQVLGATPGLVWVAGHDFFQPFDTGNLQPAHPPIRLSTYMVEDEIHSIVYPGGERLLLSARFSAAYVELQDPAFKPHYAAAGGHGALFDGQAIWTATFGTLERFSPDLETFPDLKLDLSRSWNDPQAYAMAMAADLASLWILEARGPFLYQHDLASGKYVDRFMILDPEDVIRGMTALEVILDGSRLWVLTSQELVKVALPE